MTMFQKNKVIERYLEQRDALYQEIRRQESDIEQLRFAISELTEIIDLLSDESEV